MKTARTPTVKNREALSPTELTERGQMILEYLLGAIMSDAAQQVGQQPTHNFPALLHGIRLLAAKIDENFQELSGKAWDANPSLQLQDCSEFKLQWNTHVPADWAESLSTNERRLLGQRFLRQSGAGQKGALGKKSASATWRERVRKIAQTAERRQDQTETLGKFVSRVCDELCRRTDAGEYENFLSKRMPEAPSERTVANYLRELGYKRGKYP